MNKIELGAIVAAAISVIGFAFYLGNLNSKVEELSRDNYFTQKVEEATSAAQAKIQGISEIARTPAGTISSFGGELTAETRKSLAKQGWLICDGSAVSRTEYKDLFQAIGTAWGNPGETTFSLPDLRGYFIRGVAGASEKDIDRDNRKNLKPGGNTGNSVGSYQGEATRMPVTPFKLDDAGNHQHSYTSPLLGSCPGDGCGGGTAREFPTENGSSTSNTGRHSHNVTGGDRETRPLNAYVNFIIKF